MAKDSPRPKGKFEFYCVEPLSEDGGEHSDLEVAGQLHPYVVEGSLADFVVVSVPETVSASVAREIVEQLQTQMKKPVMVITHNVMFMRARRLTRREMADVQQRFRAPSDDGGGSGDSEDRDRGGESGGEGDDVSVGASEPSGDETRVEEGDPMSSRDG